MPWRFPSPDYVSGFRDTLTFVDAEATADRIGLLVEKEAVRTTLVSRQPLPTLWLAASGEGRLRIRHDWHVRRIGIQPGTLQVVALRPWRAFPWFAYFYPITLDAADGQLYARLLTTSCELGEVHLAYQAWREAIPPLEQCRGTRQTEPARLFDLVWAYAEAGRPTDAYRTLDELRRVAPGLVEELARLAREPESDEWREAYRQITGRERWFWEAHTVTAQVEDATERVGRVEDDGSARRGKALFIDREAGAGWVKIWFPHTFLRGRHRVAFRLRGQAEAGKSPATLSVVSHFRDGVLGVPASLEWRGGPPGVGYQEIALPVETNIEPVRLEVRIEYHGSGSLAIDEITIRPDVRADLVRRLEVIGPLLPGSPRLAVTAAPAG